MGTKVGLWIDNKNAIIVFLSDKKIDKIIVKPNNYEPDIHPSDFIVDSLHKEETTRVLDSDMNKGNGNSYHYYHDVMSAIKKAESILIYGNGQTEGHLKDQLERNNLGSRIAGIETSGKLVIRQVASKAQNYFLRHKVKNEI